MVLKERMQSHGTGPWQAGIRLQVGPPQKDEAFMEGGGCHREGWADVLVEAEVRVALT